MTFMQESINDLQSDILQQKSNTNLMLHNGMVDRVVNDLSVKALKNKKDLIQVLLNKN
jgi:hypothetical protein